MPIAVVGNIRALKGALARVADSSGKVDIAGQMSVGSLSKTTKSMDSVGCEGPSGSNPPPCSVGLVALESPPKTIARSCKGIAERRGRRTASAP